MTAAIHRAIIRAFDAATYTATVQLTGSLATYLAGVPVAHHLRPNLLTAGTKCGVVFFDEANPTDAAVVLLFGGAPATDAFDVDGDLNVDGLITVGGTVDGVDVSGHAHSGAGQGGTVGHGSLSGVSADQHHAQTHTHSHDTDLTGVSADDHHARAHSIGGADHSGSLSHIALTDIGSNTHAGIDTHIAATAAHGATGPTKSLWAPCFYGPNGYLGSTYGTNGAYVGYLLANSLNQSGSTTTRMPTHFGTLTKAVAVFIPKATGNLRLSGYINHAAAGEAHQTHNTSIVNAIVAATADTMLEWDISSALTSLAAGDILGAMVNRTADNESDTCDGDVLFTGVHYEYT